MKVVFYYETKVGTIGILANQDCVEEILFTRENREAEEKETPLIRKTHEQIEAYLEGKRKEFTIPFAVSGTPFQKHVYEALLKIPYGETITYKELAQKTGNPKACRAVGSANHRNLLPILIPCHRVIGTNGTLTGYAGGLDRKEILLQIEKGF